MYNAFIFCTTTTAIASFIFPSVIMYYFPQFFTLFLHAFVIVKEMTLQTQHAINGFDGKGTGLFSPCALSFLVLLCNSQGSSNCLFPVRRKIVILTEVCSYPKLMLPCMPLSNYTSSIFPSNSTYFSIVAPTLYIPTIYIIICTLLPKTIFSLMVFCERCHLIGLW